MMYQTHQASQAGHVGGAPRGRAGGSGPSRLLLVLALFGLAALPGHATAGPGGPAAASWVPTGSMTQPRGFQSATLLPSGQVLIAGGDYFGGSVDTASANLYNPATAIFTPTGRLTTPREQHTATLLPSGSVLIAGGVNNYSGLKTAELYDPTTGTFTPTGSMSVARVFDTATLLPTGKVLLAGGCNGTFYACTTTTASAELYDPTTGTFSPTGSMSTPRQWHTATLLPTGKVLIAGGSPCQGCYPLASAELYDPATGTFTATGSMHTIRAFQTATLLPTGQVLLAGGCINVSGACYPARYTLASAELYTPWTGRFTLTRSMTVPRYNHTATLRRGGLVLIAGGANGQNGGQIGGAVASAELYTPWTGRFTATAAMNEARDVHTATRLPDGSVLVVGGCSDSSGHCNPPISATAEVFK